MEIKKINIGGTEISLQRVNLKGWTRLDVARRGMDDATSKSDFTNYFKFLVQFIEVASFSNTPIDWETFAWYDVLEVYSEIAKINAPTIDFPILHGDVGKEEKLPWEYEGRTWFFWLNLFSSNYGWTENQVECLDIDTALGLYQEISITEQMSHEWEWGLSEVSYSYNSSTKKSEFVPLSRPSWMKPIIPKNLPVVRIRKDMLPMGNIIEMNPGDKNGN